MNESTKVTLKVFLYVIISAVILSAGIYWIVNRDGTPAPKTIGERFSEMVLQKDSLVGNYVVLTKDTLLVIDYSITHQTYALSDGKSYSWKLIEKLPVVKK